ncbi:RNA polymerase II transcription mediator complex subunit 9-domain-containing protein [Phialemonium atrogriseum]|uniref:Mediator of RNA polymerase II transcription subunit 9 n=1 Tax=Phialemonium atrogriseum TaxID=1093897 RepID=A0AAJ0BY92_9PEZI|nr:RNA polymerase II transcription mediator complex subunit 9-domain-containing protein [Phialemonium atrogriseum]KAK1766486.1 RNA polymerase II transcription mediator complex subunit 9-domain-containing protein [Phialemonium atrogriseum]
MASDLAETLSPDSIDTLTELGSILARLRPSPGTTDLSTPALDNLPGLPSSNGANGGASFATPAPHPGPVTGTTPLPQPQSQLAGSASAPAPTGAGAPSSSSTTTATTAAAAGGLALKDVPTATDGLKHKLQRARARIRELPDMGRTVAQQEAEAAALEARIAAQREVLAALREVGMRFASGEEGPTATTTTSTTVAAAGGEAGDVAMAGCEVKR